MARGRLDSKLMERIAEKLRIKRTQVNVKVSKRADKLGISSEAALAILAKELGIGTAVYQRHLDPAIQTEIRSALPAIISPRVITSTDSKRRKNLGRSIVKDRHTILKAAIEFVIQDEELHSRCEDILLGKRHFDRAVNQATLVLEDRLRKKAQPAQRLVGEHLVGYSLNGDLSRTVLQVSCNQDEQRGITDIVKGIFPAFRNRTHHHLVDSFSCEDALRVCGFIDVLLRVIDNSTKKR